MLGGEVLGGCEQEVKYLALDGVWKFWLSWGLLETVVRGWGFRPVAQPRAA